MPLAVRSSSLLEDAREHPFAGVYATKMIPNDSPSPDERFRRLVEAIKLVWASTFFRAARSYRESVGAGALDERMAVVLQEVVGRRHGERFYPDLSGVARSWAFYRAGRTRPEDGVVQLALGLGKTVVDGDPTWIYAPPYPKAPPPYGSVSELVRETQTSFWAVRFGKPPAWDPVHETEYLVKAGLAEAEEDGTLRPLASTYDSRSDRLVPGVSVPGPRVVNFAPLLVHEQAPLNAAVRAALSACEAAAGGAVEMEFAATLEPGSETPLRLCILQVREMAFGSAAVEVSATLEGHAPLVLSDAVLGNGVEESVADVVFVKPGVFEQRTRAPRGRGGGGALPAASRGAEAVSPDRVRAMGVFRPVARDPGRMGRRGGSAGHRGGDAPGASGGDEPGVPLLPQPRGVRGLLLLGPIGRRRGHRLGLARSAGVDGGANGHAPRSPPEVPSGGGRRPDRTRSHLAAARRLSDPGESGV